MFTEKIGLPFTKVFIHVCILSGHLLSSKLVSESCTDKYWKIWIGNYIYYSNYVLTKER